MSKHDHASFYAFEAECARVAEYDDPVVRELEIKKAAKTLGHAFSLDEIRKRVNELRRGRKDSAEAAAPEDSDAANVIERFNEEYAVISIGGDIFILHERLDEKDRPIYERMKPGRCPGEC